MKLLASVVAAAVFALVPCVMLAQQIPEAEDPAIVNPTSIKVRLENDSVRVMEAVLPPGFKEVQHTHPPYVMYILEGGKVRLHMADGRWRDSEFKAGDVFYSDRITHWAHNTGSTTIRVLLVELRRKPAAK
jgi:beta-alanine degradation protein BauB